MVNVYIYQHDGKIVDVNIGDYTITSDGWELVYSGDEVPDLFPKGIMTDMGGYNYAYIDGEIVERGAEEIAADEAAANPPQSSGGGSDSSGGTDAAAYEKRIADLEAQLASYEKAYNEGVQSA